MTRTGFQRKIGLFDLLFQLVFDSYIQMFLYSPQLTAVHMVTDSSDILSRVIYKTRKDGEAET